MSKVDLDALFQQGLEYSARGEYDNALECFSQVTELDSSYPNAHHNAGVAALTLKNWDRAKDEFLQVIKQEPDCSDGYICLGIAHLQDAGTEISRAIDLFEYALDLEEENAEGHYWLGYSLLLLEEPNELVGYDLAWEAARHLRRAVQLAPENALAHLAHGRAEKRIGQINEASQSLRRAIEFDPNLIEAINELEAISDEE